MKPIGKLGRRVLSIIVGTVVATGAMAQSAVQLLPHYGRALYLEAGSFTSANISFGDVNGDGNLDILLAKGRHWPLRNRVLLGDGRGHVTAAYDLDTIADRSYSAHLADFNGDGALDVEISNDRDAKRIYLNDGHGHFSRGSTFGSTKWSTRNVTVADINRDGLPDLIVANRMPKSSSNYICINHGNGKFDNQCIPFAPYPATTITAADINHDGWLDLVVPHRDGGQSYVYLASPGGKFSEARRIPFGPPDAEIRAAEVADFNGDGLPDIVAIDASENAARRGVVIFYGKPGGGFDPAVRIEDGERWPYALAVGDLNKDGRPDILVGHRGAPSTIHFNQGPGRSFATEDFGDSRGDAYGFAIGDFNGDGVADIGVARSEGRNVVYFGEIEKPNGH